VKDLFDQAAVIFNRTAGKGGNAVQIPFRGADGDYFVGLDINHAVIGHAKAVADALDANDSRYLLGTVDAKNLQFFTEHENRRFIEALRKINAEKWSVPPETPPPDFFPGVKIQD
jgi:hypothetical protein